MDFLTTLSYVDRNCIGAIGQCAGSEFAIFAALTDRRIKAVCGLCCTNPGATTRHGWDVKRTVEENTRVLDKIVAQRTAEVNGEPVKYVHYVPEKEEINEKTYPLLVINGNKVGSLWQSIKAYELSNGPKELWIVEDAGHFDFYHNPVCIEKTVDKIAEFFGKTL